MSVKFKKCKVCGADIAKNAKFCPQCGWKNKKPFYKKLWFWILLILIAVAVGKTDTNTENTIETNTATNIETNTETSNANDNKTNTEEKNETAQNATQESTEYMKCSVSDMVNDLEKNAMNADDKYNKQYVEITGKLTNIDSKGAYINLSSPAHTFSLISVQCFVKNDEQRAKIAQMSTGDTVTLRGKITRVGEVLGYSLDITEIP